MSMPALIPLQCLKCQSPLPAAVDEVAWVCATCGQAVLLDESRPTGLAPLEIRYVAGAASGQQPGHPFWVAQGTVSVQRETYRGNESRQAQEFWATPHTFFVPAFDCPLDQLIGLGMKLLRQPVAMAAGRPISFLPVKLSIDDVRPMAEFIVMGIEAERRDMLKAVYFQLNLSQPMLWVLP